VTTRRAFIGTLTGGLLAVPLAAEAQQVGKVWRIGYLSPAEAHNRIDEAFERSMKDLGYVEGKNFTLERRYAAGRPDRLGAAAAELVRLSVDLIVVWSPSATAAVKDATSTIPIVFLAGGSREDLARPSGNITGITLLAQGGTLEPKYFEMLKELIPGLSRVAVLRSQDYGPVANETAESAAKALSMRLRVLLLRSPEDLRDAFAQIKTEKPQGLVAPASGLLYAHRRDVIEFAAKNRLPTVYGFRDLVPEGGLMSLSPRMLDIAGRGAFYVDKIFRGARPADLPVEQPTKFEVVINLKTAKALGLTIPQSLLARADQIIE